MDVQQLVLNHAAFKGVGVGSAREYPLPRFDAAKTYEVTAENSKLLESLGIKCAGSCNGTNSVVINGELRSANVTLNFGSSSHCIVIIDGCYQLAGQIQFEGDGHIAVICRGWYTLKADFVGRESGLYIGPSSSIGEAYLWIQGVNKSITLGSDCMFAWGVGIRTGDAHGVIDATSRRIANEPRSVRIGEHVWLAQDVLVFKGTSIGSGSVVSARSVVSKSIPSMVAAAGAPATTVKDGVTWSRQANPDQQHIDYILGLPFAKSVKKKSSRPSDSKKTSDSGER